MTYLPFLDGVVEELEILYRTRAKFSSSAHRIVLLNNTDPMTQNAGLIEVIKAEALVSDGYARVSWAPSAAPVKDTINNTVNYAVVSIVFVKGASPVTPVQYDCVALIADSHATANRAVVTTTSNAFQFGGAAHGLVVGDRVFFTGASAYPTNIVADTFYYVTATSFTSTQFRVAATAGGADIAVGASFTGALMLRYANGVAIAFEKVPNDGAGNNTRTIQPGQSLAIAVQIGRS